MKLGSSLSDVVQRVDRQSRDSRDFIAHSRHIRLDFDHDRNPSLVLDDGGGVQLFALTEHVHEQIADVLGIPGQYYRKMRIDNPELMATNVNSWLGRSDQRRLVRTVQRPISDGGHQVRALLSDRYRPLDNANLLEAVLPTLHERNVKVISSELTQRRLYIKALNERLTGEVKVGQTVMAGISISNSEIGVGAVEVRGLVYTLSCTNGAIMEDVSLRRHHVGKRHGGNGGDEIQHLLSDETRKADDRAFYLRLRDVTRAALDEAVFRQQLGKLRAAAGNAIPAENIPAMVDVTAKRFNLTETEGAGILAHLLRGGEFNQWGLSSAITRHSQDIEDYDRATDLERIGGHVIELQGGAWSSFATPSTN